MLFGSLCVLGIVAAAPPHLATPVRTMSEIVEIRPEMVASDADRPDQIRFGSHGDTQVVATIDANGVNWINAKADRERYGAGPDAPSHILVRVFDGTFAIDPFAPLPQPGSLSEWKSPVGVRAMRQLFGDRATLDTDRAIIDRKRIERTEELFRQLERARRNWLQDNGYIKPRTVRRDRTDEHSSCRQVTNEKPRRTPTPEPAGWFRKPAELPATKSREQVRRSGVLDAEGVARALARGDGQVRISVPPGTRADVARRTAQRETEREPQREAITRDDKNQQDQAES